MLDRVPKNPNRVKITPESGTSYYATITRADNPTQEGTPLNKALFDNVIAAYGTTAGTSTAYTLAGDGGFTLTDGATIKFKLHVDSGATPTINVNNTGAKAIMQNKYKPMKASTPAGTWLTATYSSTFGFFVLQGSTSSSKSQLNVVSDSMLHILGYGAVRAYMR